MGSSDRAARRASLLLLIDVQCKHTRMARLRYFIVLWLSLCVPAVALASIINAGHCQQKQSTSAPVAATSQHAMHQGKQVEHSQHLAHPGQAKYPDNGHCNCGCDCSSMQCVSGCSAFMAGVSLQSLLHYNGHFQLKAAGWSHPVAAHSPGLLRPPSLS